MSAVLACLLGFGLVVPAQSAVGSSVSVDRLAAEAPDWFTRDFAIRTAAAGPAGVPLPAEAKVPASSLAFVGIRPGQQIIISNNADLTQADYFSLCTSNFVFTNGGTTTSILGTSAGTSTKGGGDKTTTAAKGGGGKPGGSTSGSSTYSIGTAGHCGTVGEKVFMIFAPLGVVYIGDIVKSTYSESRLAPDFALISIRPELNSYVSPSMAHVGGPTGAYTGNAIVPVLHSGHGLGIGTGGTPRAGVAYQWGEEWRFEGVINKGDSGSGAVVAGGLAAGNITHIAIDARDTIPAWMGGTSITTILQLVGGLQLATCSSPAPWPAPGCPPL
ncbi:MAG TPA: hypothetical protein VNE62_03865 [Actinomycetota bacterium]|nr:hypothetical protein [Actinomycetota bacterium]